MSMRRPHKSDADCIPVFETQCLGCNPKNRKVIFLDRQHMDLVRPVDAEKCDPHTEYPFEEVTMDNLSGRIDCSFLLRFGAQAWKRIKAEPETEYEISERKRSESQVLLKRFQSEWKRRSSLRLPRKHSRPQIPIAIIRHKFFALPRHQSGLQDDDQAICNDQVEIPCTSRAEFYVKFERRNEYCES